MISCEAIQRAVADRYGLTLKQLRGPERVTKVALPRMVAMYLLRRHTTMSYPAIGAAFGGRHHTTAIGGIRKVCGLLKTDADLCVAVEAIEGRISELKLAQDMRARVEREAFARVLLAEEMPSYEALEVRP